MFPEAPLLYAKVVIREKSFVGGGLGAGLTVGAGVHDADVPVEITTCA